MNDRVRGVDVVVITAGDGEGARAYERRGREFSDPVVVDGAMTVADSDRQRWRVLEDALVLVEDESERLERLESRVAYWFAWFQFHPMTEIYD